MNSETTAPMGIALLGLLMGMRHATDPDHVIAVTTIVSRERRLTAASRVGIVWGLGHTLTVLAVGAAIIIFKIAIPIRLGLAMEFAVAIVLILLGLGAFASLVQLVVRRIAGTPLAVDRPLVVHSHAHGHGFGPHRHPHVHSNSGEDHGSDLVAPNHEHSLSLGALSSFAIRRPLLRSFGVGLVHGLAGSAAIALLVLSAIPQPLWATLYLAIFCLGTIVGMGLITTAIATPFAVAAQRMSWMHQGLITGSGLLSLGFGLFLAYRLGIVDHLFGTTPIWTPH
jgi:hypothetical protein